MLRSAPPTNTVMNCNGTVAPSVEFTTETLYIVVCYSIVFLFAFVGNVVMFLILFRNQCQKRRRVHSLLLHMTVAHLLVTMIYMPKEIVHNITVGWWGGDLLCRICKFFDVFGVALSAGILMCLSLDRFYSILFPLYVINAKRSVTRMLTVAWTVSILTSLPQIYIFRAAQHPCFDWYTQCVSADVIGQISPKVTFWFSVLNILQVYFLPLIVILICYGSILISISLKTRGASLARPADASAKRFPQALDIVAFLFQNRAKNNSSIGMTSKLSLVSEHEAELYTKKDTHTVFNKYFVPKSNSISGAGAYSNPTASSAAAKAGAATTADPVLRRTGGENSFQRAKNRTLKMTVVLVLAFLLCWTPYTVAMFIHFLYASQRIIPPLLRKFLYAFAVFNSAISPYLYGYFSFDIWEELRLLLLYFCPTPGYLAHCGCRKFGKGAAENAANRRHAIRVRTTGELSSSTLLPPTTTVSAGLIRYKQQQQQDGKEQPQTMLNYIADREHIGAHLNYGSGTLASINNNIFSIKKKACSFDDATAPGANRADEFMRLVIHNEINAKNCKQQMSFCCKRSAKTTQAPYYRQFTVSNGCTPSSNGNATTTAAAAQKSGAHHCAFVYSNANDPIDNDRTINYTIIEDKNEEKDSTQPLLLSYIVDGAIMTNGNCNNYGTRAAN